MIEEMIHKPFDKWIAEMEMMDAAEEKREQERRDAQDELDAYDIAVYRG
jgi:hypothetical protein